MSPAPEPQIFTPSPMSAQDMSSLASLIATLSYNLGNTMLDPSPTMSSNFAASSLLSQYISAMSAGAPLATAVPATSPTTLLTSLVSSPQASSGGRIPAASTAPSGMFRGTLSAGSSVTSPAASSGTTGLAATSLASISTPVAGGAQSSTHSSAATATGTSAPANVSTIEQNSGGMSSGIQAAIAVPIVLVALGVVLLALLCVRRRKRHSTRSNDGSSIDEKSSHPGAVAAAVRDKNRKRWTRHLRVFSFDTELLMGSRYSSTNSIRSRQTGSMRSTSRNLHSSSRPPSERSADEVAPAYRDAVSAGTPAHPQSLNEILAGGAMAAAAANNMKRNSSTATAPPPYRGGSRYPSPTSSPQTPTRTRHGIDPFSDPQSTSPIVSPVERSPFDDSADNTPNVSRNSSLLHRVDEDDASLTDGASDAASIHQATLARNGSTMSGARQARMIDVRRST